jgi:hypothetical protein
MATETSTETRDVFYRRLFIQLYAILLTVFVFAYVTYASFFHDFTTQPDSMRIIDTVVGFFLGVALTTTVNYFFGSSQGSAEKQEQIERMGNRTEENNQV